MATKEINLGPININSVETLRFPLYKDGEPWIGIDSVEAVFEAPDRETQFTRALEKETPDAGVWLYTTDNVGDVDTGGWWTVALTVTDGTIVKTYPYEIGFEAVDQRGEG